MTLEFTAVFRVVRLDVVLPADKDGLAGGAHLGPVADVDDLERAGEVDRGREIDTEARLAQLASEADRAAEELPAVDLACRAGVTHARVS